MYSDRDLANRRNMKGDVTAAANNRRRFLQLEVETRVIAAATEIFGMSSLDDQTLPRMPLPISQMQQMLPKRAT